MKQCPFCGETIQEKAIKCKHCKKWLEIPDSHNENIKERYFSSHQQESIKSGELSENISDIYLPLAFLIFGFSSGLQTRGGILFVIFGGIGFYFIGKKVVRIINNLDVSKGKKIFLAFLAGIIAFLIAITIGGVIREVLLK